MRAALALAVALLVALLACGDVLHSTGDIRTACEIDASRAGCSAAPPSTDGGPTDFCAWSRVEAQERAVRACAWIGACEPPAAGTAFGACMFQALMAYDCAANPSHRPMGDALAGWRCLASVASCADVDGCVQPAGPAACLLSMCLDAGDVGECDGDVTGECSGTTIRTCTADGGEVAIDCAGNGAQACGVFADAGVGWAACAAAGDGGACAPSRDVACDGGVARSCPSGVVETLDCAALLGSSAACNEGTLDPAFDWTSPCDQNVLCAADLCAGGVVNSCARGTTFAGDCAKVGLGACRVVPADDGTVHAACTPP